MRGQNKFYAEIKLTFKQKLILLFSKKKINFMISTNVTGGVSNVNKFEYIIK